MSIVSTPDEPMTVGTDLTPHQGPEATAPPALPAGTPAADSSLPTGGRFRRPLAVGSVALTLAAAVVVAVVATTADGDDTAAESGPETIRAVTVERQDLVAYTDLAGTMTYADIETVAAPTDGVLTEISAVGTTLERGDVVHAVNAQPVPLFHGDVPLYRTMAEGDEGDDVRLLEANLAALGYHLDPDGAGDDGEQADDGFAVDGRYDAATTRAVQRWQDDLGRPETGLVAPTDVVVTSGPVVVIDTTVEIGDRVGVGTPLVELAVTGTVATVHTAHDGEIELVAGPGPVVSGDVLYTVDDRPVVALVTDVALDRDLADGIDDGDDVRVLEEALVAQGYDARGALDVDDRFDTFTVEALEDWQRDLADTHPEVAVTGRLDLDDVLVVAPGTSIDVVADHGTDVLATGTELFATVTAGGSRIVTTEIDVADRAQLPVGAVVAVEFPDGTTADGEVIEVALSSTTDPADPGADPVLPVEIALVSIPDSVVGLNELDVTVKLVDQLAADAAVVPAAALLATADGGYAVEVVDADRLGTTFVTVEPGMFADGVVEVTGVEPGQAVVVPS